MKEATADIITAFLRDRKQRGHLVSSKFADAIHVSRAFVSQMLNGEQTFPMKHLDDVAAFYGLDVVEFIQLARAEAAKARRTKAPGSER